jgi:sodium/potassium-transporting ATPase subunit alpha
MHVDNLAIFDTDFDPQSFRTVPEPDTSGNLLQVVAIGAICNAATFDNNIPMHNKSKERPISGNATGDFFTISESHTTS